MMIEKIKKNKNGFVLLFAVTLSAILLAIALGVANIAFNEVKFGTNAKDTNNAFFAADTGAECALFYDKLSYFKMNSSGNKTIKCIGANINVPSGLNKWTFDVLNLGNGGQGCARVTVDKSTLDADRTPAVIITSDGYNNATCSSGSNTVVRQLEVR